jgi:DNA mismatch endonuclease (patch repair protein)
MYIPDFKMDMLSKTERSALMSKVRSRGNRSTEVRLRLALVRARISGWELHPESVPGRPDFWFAAKRMALFVDGCFWHGCKRCLRLPQRNRSYWRAKIDGNIRRAVRVNRKLRSDGIIVFRVWEHELQDRCKLDRILGKLCADLAA